MICSLIFVTPLIAVYLIAYQSSMISISFLLSHIRYSIKNSFNVCIKRNNPERWDHRMEISIGITGSHRYQVNQISSNTPFRANLQLFVIIKKEEIVIFLWLCNFLNLGNSSIVREDAVNYWLLELLEFCKAFIGSREK